MWLKFQVQIRIDFRIWFQDEKTRVFSETNFIMKFSSLKCSKNRTWRKLLIWTWSCKIKFSHFVKLLFSQHRIQNKNFCQNAVLVQFISWNWVAPENDILVRREIKVFFGWVYFMHPCTSINWSVNQLIYVKFTSW